MLDLPLNDTPGHLGKCAIDGEVLTLVGWVATFDGRPVEGFRVIVAGRPVTNFQMECGLPSPDVQTNWPDLPQAHRCRFRLRIPVPRAEQARIRQSVILCTPLIGRWEGRPFTGLIEPVLPIPPQEAVQIIGGGDCRALSLQFLGHFVQKLRLQPLEDVLEVGCGVGRMAYSLAHYLLPTARYEGFDIIGSLIEWTQTHITPRFPNFTFSKVDVFNKFYNPNGALQAQNFRFPYEAERFDVAILTSVFTHMLTGDVLHYLDELYRVLRPGGRCFCTFFLLNAESQNLIREGKSTLNLAHPVGECFVHDIDVPEGAVGFEEARVFNWIVERGFTIVGKYLGNWCGRKRCWEYQDILVFSKPKA
jgi:ubiquinone/menaquinone biosynthesis C-methylase UbiE